MNVRIVRIQFLVRTCFNKQVDWTQYMCLVQVKDKQHRIEKIIA
jgi:hypothetical protein